MSKSNRTPAYFRVTAPAWPLQSTVAVNPFWNQIDTPFVDVMHEMESFIHTPLFMPFNFYLEKFKNGMITEEDIKDALNINHFEGEVQCLAPADIIAQSSNFEPTIKEVQAFTDFLDRTEGTSWGSLFLFELSKYAAAFFDSGQALAQFPFKNLSFLDGWIQSQAYDQTLALSGLKNLKTHISIFNGLDSKQVIKNITQELNLDSETLLPHYLARLSTTVIGWASQFRYHEWQLQLGYPSNDKACTEDFIAVRMILDFALIKASEIKNPGISTRWLENLKVVCETESLLNASSKLRSVWQTALEIREQKSIAAKINPSLTLQKAPQFQIAMCIDVRSELYRRALESQSEFIETIGFAGFFGMPFDYEKINENKAGHRLPVLLSPAFKLKEEVKSGSENKLKTTAMVQSYFRNLRKAPLSSFLYVELFGILSLKESLSHIWKAMRVVQRNQGIPKRFSDQKTRPSLDQIFLPNHEIFTVENKIDRACGALTHMGLKTRFSRLIVISGHGSMTRNNAFNSSLDCGACGGNAGDINARVLCDLINNPAVRLGLKTRGIHIPETTHFIAAIHETVNDELFFLDEEAVPVSHQSDLAQLKLMVLKAGAKARAERQTARSTQLDAPAQKRANNWSEVRPEWGLAGNSAFIVAPRTFTKSQNFSSRIFLHDYNWKTDQDFKTLELIMTAPMIVTNWINMQYYASTVAPKVFGAGNKILHNLVNESGVVEGNGGDLKIGLPWQSVHDGKKFVHEPLRLSVFLAAPISEIEKIIQNHETVKNLVDNHWLTLHYINESTGTLSRRESLGSWNEYTRPQS